MYIFRWLMKNPVIILALYFLSIIAVLYSMTGGNTSDKNADGSLVKKGSVSTYFEKHGVDLSNAPTIEPSSLTTALVTGDTLEEAKNTEANQVAASEGSDTTTSASAEDSQVVIDEEPSTQFSEMSEEELLLMAREAYWNNGLEESAQIYQQLINQSPAVIDYKGELGNVYWRQGFPEKAAELYAEIALPMIEEGNSDRVANMVGFIGLFFPEKATEIHNILQADQ
ncbi:MAG: hypothetical protein V7749_13130 [Cocleimonas sp.]